VAWRADDAPVDAAAVVDQVRGNTVRTPAMIDA